MLERLFDYMKGHDGVRFVTMDEMADDFATRVPAQEVSRAATGTAAIPAGAGPMCALCGVLGGRRSLERRRRRGPASSRATPIRRGAAARAHAAHPRSPTRSCAPTGCTLSRLAGPRPTCSRRRPARPRSSTISPISGRPPSGCRAGPAIRSTRISLARLRGGAVTLTSRLHAGPPAHRLPRLGQDDAAAPAAGRPGAGGRGRADQRVRRGRARPSPARADRRHHGAAASPAACAAPSAASWRSAIRDLLSSRERGLVPAFGRLVIESTGLADPFPILSTLQADPVLGHHFALGNR